MDALGAFRLDTRGYDLDRGHNSRSKGMRWAWIATVAFSILGLVLDAISGFLTWHGVVSTLIVFVLLLLPVTRRYFSEGTAVGAEA